MSARILVLNYGMGNIHSMLKALRLYSQNVHYSADPAELRKADAVVLPGDGAFAAAMQGLGDGRREALLEHIQAGKPLLGVCIGFQILFQDSNEVFETDSAVDATVAADLTPGLQYFQGEVRKFKFADSSVRIPHMGWNQLEYTAGARGHKAWQVAEGHYAYFIHSYRAEQAAPQDVLAYANYAGDRFAAIVARENVLATQFHPEKSDVMGLAMIQGWVQNL